MRSPKNVAPNADAEKPVGARGLARFLDWTVLVVGLASASTLLWACFLLWATVRAVAVVLS